MALKIAATHVNEKGETGIHPDVMKMLIDFAEHSKLCEQCEPARQGIGTVCTIGEAMIRDMLKHPDVTQVEDDYGKN